MTTYLALAIFTLTYLVIASQKIPYLHLDRPSGVLMVLSGVLTLDEAYRAINYDTITLLLGMMILVGNPQNMLVGIYSGWSYGGFLLRLLPIGRLGLLLNFGLIFHFLKKSGRKNLGPIAFVRAARGRAADAKRAAGLILRRARIFVLRQTGAGFHRRRYGDHSPGAQTAGPRL